MRKKVPEFYKLGLVLLAVFLLSLAGHIHQEQILAEAKAEYDAAGETLYRTYETGFGSKEDLERLSTTHTRYWTLQREQAARGSPARMSAECMYLSGIGLFLWVLTFIGRGTLRAAKWSVAREEYREQDKDPWEEL